MIKKILQIYLLLAFRIKDKIFSKKAFQVLFLWACILNGLKLSAQDIHFSQYNAAPLSLNPALTGFFDADYRVALNYRGQWGSFSKPFRTIGASAEYNPLRGHLKYDNLAVGFQVYNDVAGESRYGSNSIGVSAAYRKALGSRNKQALTVGLQFTALQQRIQFSDLQFDNQFNGVEFDETIAPNEILNKNSGFTPDLSTGLLFQSKVSDDFNYYLGGAMFHVLRPKISLFDASNYKLPSRYVFHAGSYIYVTEIVNILPSAAYYKQAGSWQMNLGTYVQFVLDDWNDQKTAFAIGTWARIASPAVDAFIFGARLDFQGFIFGFSYDFNISNLSVATDTRGAYEFSMIYSGIFSTKAQRKYHIPCPQL